MGVNVSRPQRRSKVKYIQTDYDGEANVFDESERFLNESSQQEAIRGGKSFSKRNEPGFFQFKVGRGKSRCTFDSLDTIDSRKSVPFAVLPANNTRASTNSRSGENEDLNSDYYDEETIGALGRSGKVLFVDEPMESLEQGGKSTEKSAGKMDKEDTARRENDGEKFMFSHSRTENRRIGPVSHATQRKSPDGRENKLKKI